MSFRRHIFDVPYRGGRDGGFRAIDECFGGVRRRFAHGDIGCRCRFGDCGLYLRGYGAISPLIDERGQYGQRFAGA